jgi:hypothetical protein
MNLIFLVGSFQKSLKFTNKIALPDGLVDLISQ